MTAPVAVRDHNGKPAIFVDGMPLNPQAYRIQAIPVDPAYLRRFVQAGIRLFVFDLTDEPELTEEEHFRNLDTKIQSVLALANDIILIPSIRFLHSAQWAKDNPDALTQFEDGSRNHFMGQNAPEQRYSLASPIWQAEAERILKLHIRHFEAAPYCERIIGYHIRCGHCGEWNFWWDIVDTAVHGLDFSPGMIAWLRQWLRGKYQDDVARLRAAWADAAVTFETAMPPDIALRNAPSHGEFFLPDQCAQVLDYKEAQEDVAAERAIHLCRIAKEASSRPVLAGVFNGGFRRVIGRLLNSPHVDFLASPPPYENRGPGDYTPLHTTPETIALHGKIWISEVDLRTHLSVPDRYGSTPRQDWALQVLKRDFANTLVHGNMAFWYDFARKWYDDDATQETMTRLQAIGHASLDFDRSSAAEFALIVHRQAAKYTAHRCIRYGRYQDELGLEFNLVDRQIVQEMGRVGFPFDFYSLFDLDHAGWPHYKVYYFLNAFALNAAERAAIERLKCDNNTLVFIYAAGWINPDARPSASTRFMKDLTGFDFEVADIPRVLASRITAAGERWLGSVKAGAEFGTFARPLRTGFEFDPERPERLAPPFAANPVFYPQPGNAAVLAEYTFDSRPSMVGRDFGDWTSVYIGATAVPTQIVRALGAKAGVHVYGDQEDILYANRKFVGIHTCHPGEHRIVLPESRCIVDAYSGQMLAEDASAITFQSPEACTHIYFTGTREEARRHWPR